MDLAVNQLHYKETTSTDYAFYTHLLLGKIDISISQTNVTCNKGKNGSASAIISCGLKPYSYSWNTIPIQNTATATGLSAGTYILTVTDARNSTQKATVIITEPTAITISITKTDVSCGGGSNGNATSTVQGGIPPYNYSWNSSPIQTSEIASNLIAGNYSLTVEDSKGCVNIVDVKVSEPPKILVETSKKDVSCNGGIDGYVIANVTGGTSGYGYSWNTIPVQKTQEVFGLKAGDYTVTIRDINGCSITKITTIEQPESLNVTFTQTKISCNNAKDGTATAIVTGGTPPYLYLWDANSGFQKTATATGLDGGTKFVL